MGKKGVAHNAAEVGGSEGFQEGNESEKKEETSNPKIKIISPQKKLIDIQAVLEKARWEPMTMHELHTAIQNILDGE